MGWIRRGLGYCGMSMLLNVKASALRRVKRQNNHYTVIPNPYCLIFIAFGIAGCVKTPQWVKSIKKGNYELVRLTRYPYARREIIYEPDKFIKLRKELEKETELFDKIVYHFYPEDTHKLNFEYKYATMGERKVVLRYFSMIHEPNLYAGYSLEFVVEDGGVKEIYLYRTPLE